MNFLKISLFSIIIFGCHPKDKIIEKVEKVDSRILSNGFINILSELIQIQNRTFDNKETNRDFDKNTLYVSVFSTESFLYLKMSFMDCETKSHFAFREVINSHTLHFRIYSKSIGIEKYFKLKGLEGTANELVSICDDWYWVYAKFSRDGDELNLLKIATFFDNSFQDTFFDEYDSAFLYKNEILFTEPEPEPLSKKNARRSEHPN